ncbi:hypothetical protein [Microbacterium sp. MMO-56]|uniref:hypothetical protein n=1 Tax=Microbacterium sp. MMO-56 TaxID=3081281 RepID=UPI003019F3E7
MSHCDLCDEYFNKQPSLADDPDEEPDICRDCADGRGLAVFLVDGSTRGSSRVDAPAGRFPATVEYRGAMYALEYQERMIARYRNDDAEIVSG